MKRCRHLNTIGRAWNRVHGYWYEAHWDIRPDAHVCLACGSWLSLGPSNDADERVAQEMRAAELAARRKFGSFFNCGAGCERCGFVTHKNSVDDAAPHPSCRPSQFHAGYLAYAIVTHEENQ